MKAITATQRYRWTFALGGEPTDAVYAARARTALDAITEDVEAMTVVLPYPAGLHFRPLDADEVPTRLLVAGLPAVLNPARTICLEEPVDPWWPAAI